jgi:tetratricopeptide (TPR) repeat protein
MIEYARRLAGILGIPGRLLAVAFMVCCATPSQAQIPMTDEEWKILPEWCRQKEWTASNHRVVPGGEWRASAWGPDYIHIHHYCWAMIQSVRSYKFGLPKQQRLALLGSCDDNMDYVFRNSRYDPPVPILAEMLTFAADCNFRRSEDGKARQLLARAKEANPKYWRQYFLLANHLLQIGKEKDALEAIDEGLREIPESGPLKKLQSEILAKGKTAESARGGRK